MTASINSKATQPITSLEIGRIAVLIPNCKDKTMTDKLMYIPNYDTQNYLFSKFDKVLKVVKPTNKKMFLKKQPSFPSHSALNCW